MKVKILMRPSEKINKNMSDNDRGCLEACKNCSGFNCCGVISRGGRIEPPFLTHYDIGQIEAFTGLKQEFFSERVTNPTTGNYVHLLKSRDNACVFFDAHNGKCRIYNVRPIDCRIFPLDIKKVDTKFFWVLYDYAHCHLTQEDELHLLDLRPQALSVLGKDIVDYATFPVPGMEQMAQKIIEEIEVPSECIC